MNRRTAAITSSTESHRNHLCHPSLLVFFIGDSPVWQLSAAKVNVIIEQSTHIIGVYHDWQPQESTDREPRRNEISRLLAPIANA